MPRFTIDNTEYVCSFRHDFCFDLSCKHYTDMTRCVILAGPAGSRDYQKHTVAFANAIRHPRDTPNRVVARTLALKRALEKSDLPPDVQAVFRKTIRWQWPSNVY